MITPAVPVDNTAYTIASASGARTYAHVTYLGAYSVHPADPHLGEPEPAIDLETAAEMLLRSRDIEEASSPTVALGSPFGI